MGRQLKQERFALTLPFRTGGEKLLQYIWQLQYFNKSELRTTTGEELEIIFPGKLNTNQGPDFIQARIKIDNTILVGSIELHLKTSHWNDHGHSKDPNYNNVILHVVFEDDEPPASLPVLELQPRISNLLLERYSDLMNSSYFIPCGHSVSQVKEITWLSWKERLVAERLTRKSTNVLRLLEESKGHWEETFWWLLARSFGMKVNSDAFESVAKSIPISILGKHKNQIHQVEALLFGQAGLLKGAFAEEYPKLLQREYAFLRKKYDLAAVHDSIQFLRMRPGNFPTVRLAELAALIQNSVHLFSRVLEIEKVTELRKLFGVTANDYWHYHYQFDQASSFKKKVIGSNATNNIIINTIVPVLFAYGALHKEEKYKTKAINWLEDLEPEVNFISKGFAALGVKTDSAFDSQALIELKTQYCDDKNCLRCAVGNMVLKSQD
ncbi:MAG TPA: DUF2851 family protein [Flavisolibacter sp.]